MHELAIRECVDCGHKTGQSDEKVKEGDKKYHIYDCMECGSIEKVEIVKES